LIQNNYGFFLHQSIFLQKFITNTRHTLKKFILIHSKKIFFKPKEGFKIFIMILLSKLRIKIVKIVEIENRAIMV